MLSDGSVTHLYGLGRIGSDGSGGWGYHLGDALGSLRQLTDASGKITLTQSFEPFGAPLSGAGTDSSEFGFTGEQDDIAGLVFLRARFYDPGSGRLITKDRFPGYSSLPSTLHPYSYALNNTVNLVDPSGQNPFLALAAVSFIAGFGIDTWNQYQKNGGWCGFDPLSAIRSGITAAVAVSLVTMTVLSGASLLGIGLQGFGVLFNSVTLFGAGLSVSGVATAATVWFMTSKLENGKLLKLIQKPATQSSASDFGLGRRVNPNERVIIFESQRGSGEFNKFDPAGLSAQSLDVARTPEQAIQNAFSRLPKPNEPYWVTTGQQIADARRFAYFDYGLTSDTPGHISIYGGEEHDALEFIKIWIEHTFGQ